jgi:hypothetical protein
MADVTNSGEPTAGGQLSGETARAWAVKRLKKLEGQTAPPAPMLPKGS